MELKTKLIEMKEMTNEQLTIQKADEIINQMLNNIGSTDAELRDSLIYSTFAEWIDKDYLTAQQLLYILEKCLDQEHLYHQIGEMHSDSVFTRSFSSLVIAVILYKDMEINFLNQRVVLHVFGQSLSYLRQENDVRGYVEVKGWAHSIAHGADMLVACIKHRFFGAELFEDALDALHQCLFKGTVYVDDEDKRLIYMIDALMDKGMGEDRLEQWIINVNKELEDIHKREGRSRHLYKTRTNVLNFLKTLYFRLGCNNDRNLQVKGQIEQVISVHNP